jgi:Biopolymer transport protein ExbD/TolR
MATDAVKKSGDGSEAFDINLTPMIDVVFQLIIFFMCAMKFKTLERKIEAYLPKDRGLAATPERIDERVNIKVVIKQTDLEGVPHFVMFEEDLVGSLGPGVPRMGTRPVAGKDLIDAYTRARDQHWRQYIEPKLAAVKQRIETSLRADRTLPCEIDAEPKVRHAYVIAVLDAFLEVCDNLDIEKPEITFVGTPPARAGD